MADYAKDFTLYKARKDGNGVASQWSLRPDKRCVFFEMAEQTGKNENGDATFGWGTNKLTFKLGISDIGEVLAVISGLQDGVGPKDISGAHKGLFHSNPKGNSILKFGLGKNGMYNVYLSVKRDDQQQALFHTVSNGELCVLGVLLRKATELIHKWC